MFARQTYNVVKVPISLARNAHQASWRVHCGLERAELGGCMHVVKRRCASILEESCYIWRKAARQAEVWQKLGMQGASCTLHAMLTSLDPTSTKYDGS